MLKSFEKLCETELSILESGKWGTIGPHSVAAGGALAKAVGRARAILCCSADAALESVLRGMGAGYGRIVCVPALCSPVLVHAARRTGAAVVFCPCGDDGTPDADALAAILTKAPVCVLADAAAVTDAVTAACKGAGVPLAAYIGGDIRPQLPDAAALVGSTGPGSAVNAGSGGFAACDDKVIWARTFAAHNCGRDPSEGSTLVLEGMGGDMRVSEFVSAAVEQILQEGSFDTPAPAQRVRMDR